MIMFLYIVLLFLILRFTVTLFNFLSNPKLGHYGRKFSDLVSVIITREEGVEQNLLDSLDKQDYRNIEILLQKDTESLTELVERAKGKYLLFVDEHLLLKAGLMNSMIYRMKVFELALLTLVPNRDFNGLIDRVLSPLPDMVIINLLPLRLVRLLRSPVFSAAEPKCMLFDANIYKSNDWLTEAEEKGWPVTRVGRLVKERQYKLEILIANRMLWYKTMGSANYQNDLLQSFGNNIFSALTYLILVVFGPLLMLLNFEGSFIALPLGLIFLARIMISFLTDQNPVASLVLHPLQMFSLTFLIVEASVKKLMTIGK